MTFYSHILRSWVIFINDLSILYGEELAFEQFIYTNSSMRRSHRETCFILKINSPIIETFSLWPAFEIVSLWDDLIQDRLIHLCDACAMCTRFYVVLYLVCLVYIKTWRLMSLRNVPNIYGGVLLSNIFWRSFDPCLEMDVVEQCFGSELPECLKKHKYCFNEQINKALGKTPQASPWTSATST